MLWVQNQNCQHVSFCSELGWSNSQKGHLCYSFVGDSSQIMSALLWRECWTINSMSVFFLLCSVFFHSAVVFLHNFNSVGGTYYPDDCGATLWSRWDCAWCWNFIPLNGKNFSSWKDRLSLLDSFSVFHFAFITAVSPFLPPCWRAPEGSSSLFLRTCGCHMYPPGGRRKLL